MAQLMEIVFSLARNISRSQRIEMLGRNLERPPLLRLKRAEQLLKLMRLDEADAELAGDFAASDLRAANLLRSEALLFRDDPHCAAQATELLGRIVPEPLKLKELAALNVRRANALAASGDLAQARAIAWHEAMRPTSDAHAISLLLRLGLSQAEAQALLVVVDAANLPTREMSLRLALLARTGQMDLAKGLSGFERFFQRKALFKSLSEAAALNAAIATEIRASPDLFYSAGRRPGRHLWRTEGLPQRGMVAIPKLFEALEAAVKTYAASLKDEDHPFPKQRPARAKISAWAAIAGADGYEEWHTHDRGWVSGVYYVAMPAALAGDRGGAIEFGWPGGEDLACATAGVSIASHHPAAGELLLFPSYQHHRTIPLKRAVERISIAFDVVPS
jgi:Putative 2OG-Fe(II) oxygenase